MSFALSIVQGLGGTFRLSEPRPVPTISRTDVDSLPDYWFSDCFPNPLLTEGVAHPLYPGMILDTAAFEEMVPPFPAVGDQPATKGEYRVTCNWLGDARGNSPTKFISRSATRTVGIGFDQFGEKYISWHAEPMAVSGTASSNTVNHPGNTFADGLRIAFPQLAGSSLQSGNSVRIPTVYYVINRTADGYQVAATLGGAAVALVTDITAGYVLDARFCAGTPHPLWPNMYVANIATSDNYTNWKNVDVSYVGMQFAKPLHSITTCAGVQVSSSTPIAWDFTDGWTTELNSNVQMPEVCCTETELTVDTLASDLVPSSSGEVGTPSDAPLIRSVSLSLSEDKIVHNWPNGWSILGKSHVDKLNLKVAVSVQKTDWRYIWPILLK